MGTSKFDIADYLYSKVMIAEYLNTVLEEGDNNDLINAIGHIEKAIRMTKITEETGLSRASLYKAMSDGTKSKFANIMKVLKAIGGQIQVNSVKKTYRNASLGKIYLSGRTASRLRIVRRPPVGYRWLLGCLFGF